MKEVERSECCNYPFVILVLVVCHYTVLGERPNAWWD